MPSRRALPFHTEPHYLDLPMCKVGSEINSTQTTKIASDEPGYTWLMKGKHIKSLISCLLLGTLIGFFVGGGWEILFKFADWRSETFYRAEGLEVVHLAIWFWYKPALATAIGFFAGAATFFFMHSSPKQS